MNKEIIKLFDIVGANAIETEKAIAIRNTISEKINNSIQIEVDFDGVTQMHTFFLNPLIGDLYAEFSSDQLKKFLIISNVSDGFKEMFPIVINRAKRFYKNEGTMSKILEEEFGYE